MDRQLNACGFSSETIAAEYETDAALAEAGNDLADPYFTAAWKAEEAHRAADWEAQHQTEEADPDPVVEPHCDGFPTTCPNPVTVPPAPPHHNGGIRCGCYDKET